MNLVYVLEMMECDWDCDKYIKGIFSNPVEAVEYVRSNYYLLEDDWDICIPNYPIKGNIFHQYGYEVHPSEVLEDEEGLYYMSQYDVDEPEHKEYMNTQTSFTIRGVVLDGLLT